MTILTTNNAESFGYKPQQSAGGPTRTNSPGWNMAGGMGAAPNPSIGSSVNYVQGLQNESRTQTFAQGSKEGQASGGGDSGGGAGGVLSGIKNIFGGGGGAGDAAAGGEAATAGAGLAEDAAIVAV